MELSIGLMLVPMLTRVIVAAFIVILVAKLVVRLGPSMGGLIAGLPVGLGPGFYFLMLESDKSFLYERSFFLSRPEINSNIFPFFLTEA